jgi:hypothetical protein
VLTCNSIAEISLACTEARGMLALKANAPTADILARYFFMIFSFDLGVVNY